MSRTLLSLLFLLGWLVVAYGVWLIYQPAGVIVLGLSVMALAIAVRMDDGHRR